MTTSERLLARLREAGLPLPQGTRLVRVHPSRSMRNEGAWSWAALGPGAEDLQIGSQYSMGELLSAELLYITTIQSGAVSKDVEVHPAKACRNCAVAAPTTCRICRAPFCRSCFTDHHHEGYGTPATDF